MNGTTVQQLVAINRNGVSSDRRFKLIKQGSDAFLLRVQPFNMYRGG